MLLVTNARLPTCDFPVDLFSNRGRIQSITPTSTSETETNRTCGESPTPPTMRVEKRDFHGETQGFAGASGRVLDGCGMTLLPGLVNGHTHAAMSLFRGYGDDMPLTKWLETRIWPVESRLTPEDVYWGAKLACLEMIRSGTVRFQDMYWHYDAVARAVTEMGLRAGIGAIMIDVGGEEQGMTFRALIRDIFEKQELYASDRITFTLAPHAIYTVSEKQLRWIAEFSELHHLPVHIHLSETHEEVSNCLKQHGVRPAFYLDRAGLLTHRVMIAHGVYLNEEELDLIARRGATLITNPVSNMKLAVGAVFPYQQAMDREIPIAIGTDGTASNNSLDLFQEIKMLALLQKQATSDPTVLPANDAWSIVTGAKAPLLGQSGTISVGDPADFLLVQTELPEMQPEHDLISNLIYSATGYSVNTTVVAGRVLMHNRIVELEIGNETEIRDEAVRRATEICREN